MDKQDFISLVLYYGRSKFFHSMQKASLDGLAKFPSQIVFRLLNGIALALGLRVQEAIRELNPLKNEQDMGLASILALIYSHRRCNAIDKDALSSLELKLKAEFHNLSPNSAYYAAIFLFLTDKLDKARDYVDKALKLQENFEEAIVLKAWTELQQNVNVNRKTSNALEKVLSRGKNVDASLGLARYFQLNSDFDKALSILNKISVRFPDLNVPLIEKMETMLAAWDWDQAFETSLRIINLEPTNVSALRIKVLILLCKEGNTKAAVANLQLLLTATERIEMGNSKIIMQICVLFSRICSRNKDILEITHKYMEKLTRVNHRNVEYITELGYQNILIGSNKDALKCFRSASDADNNFFLALCGLTLCHIMENLSSDQARQQIEFLGDLKGIKRSPLLLVLASKISEKTDRAKELLIEATELHFKKLSLYSFGVEYLLNLDADLLIQITIDLMRHCSVQAQSKIRLKESKDELFAHFKHCLRILEVVIKACPSHLHALYIKAKIEFLCGEYSMATSSINRILSGIDVTFTDAYLLLCQIQIEQNDFTRAMQSLDICLSHNFTIREHPLYQLLMGIVQKHQKKLSEAQKSFLNAMKLIESPNGNEHVHEKDMRTSEKSLKLSHISILSTFSQEDKVTLYLELIDVLIQSGSNHENDSESERLLEMALLEFKNTPQKGRLILAQAENLVQKGNIAKAIELLSGIQPNQYYYLKAKTKLAHIYLYHRKDRVAFARCYKELVKNIPETESYLILGDAYMNIQEPELAVQAYEEALHLNPNNNFAAGKLGRAYVKTHRYAVAIKYYTESLKHPDHFGLKLDLAELYLKLKQYNIAAEILSGNSEKLKINERDVGGVQLYTKQLLLLARVQEKSGNIDMSLQTLKEARAYQYRVLKRLSVEEVGSYLDQNKILSKICLLMSQQYMNLRENDQALICFKECLMHTPSNIEILVSLARLYMQMNAMDLCRDICMQILQIDPTHEAASVMMADLSFRQMDFENAAYHFSQLLICQPCYWTALARLIEVSRRSGTLSDIEPFLQRAEQYVLNTSPSPGLSYCKGLYEWYSGNSNSALRQFNTARKDYEWGQQAVFNMIEICISPDGDLPCLNDTIDTSESGDFSESRLIALRTAERLIKELRPSPGGIDNCVLDYKMLHNFLQLATKQKFQIESALQDFTKIAAKEEYHNSVAPVLGMASALILLKQSQRAKNHLKRIARVPWNFQEGEYLERCWLMLGDIYIHSNKLDVAESFIKRVLEHNKSSAKGYELGAHIAEKNQTYRVAAKYYHSAWICGGRSNPHIGYKLAYNYMKIKRYANAIDICQEILKSNPDYIVLKKSIIHKSRNYLRT